MSKPDRIPCCVLFCRRTAPNNGRFEGCREIICGKHWRLARPTRRRTYTRIVREINRTPNARAWWHLPGGSPERLRCIKLWRVVDKLWAAIRAEIIEAAAGLA